MFFRQSSWPVIFDARDTLSASNIFKMKRLLVTVLLLVTLCGCDSGGRVENTKALSNEIKASQIKRVTNTQLIYSANEWGKKIAEIAEKALSERIKKDPGQAQQLCGDLSQIAIVAALEKEYGVQIQLLGANDIKNPELAAKEREILDAYLFSAKGKSTSGDNLQQLNDTLLVYNAPLSAESPVCKECMKDQEIPFAVWRLLFSKKEIIRKLDVKQLKN
jgi:hypothetical protein